MLHVDFLERNFLMCRALLILLLNKEVANPPIFVDNLVQANDSGHTLMIIFIIYGKSEDDVSGEEHTALLHY